MAQGLSFADPDLGASLVRCVITDFTTYFLLQMIFTRLSEPHPSTGARGSVLDSRIHASQHTIKAATFSPAVLREVRCSWAPTTHQRALLVAAQDSQWLLLKYLGLFRMKICLYLYPLCQLSCNHTELALFGALSTAIICAVAPFEILLFTTPLPS